MSVTAAIEAPTGWTRVRLGSISVRRQATGFADLPLLSVFLGDGVIPRDQREDNHNQVGSDLAKYQRVLPGDIVFNKLRTWQGGFGVSRYDGIISPAYIIVAPDGNEVHSGFLHHLLRSEPYLAELTRLSKWMPPSQFDIAWEDIRSMELVLPPLPEQARIAHFLDDQTTRIDQIITGREQQIALMGAVGRETRGSLVRGLESPEVETIDRPGWLGPVSKEFEARRIGSLASVYAGAGFPIDHQGREDGDLPFMKVSDLASADSRRMVVRANNYVDAQTARALGAKPAPIGTIVFPKVGAALLTNRRAVLGVEAVFDNNVMGLRFSGADTRFMLHVMSDLDLGRFSNPGPVPSVNETTVKDILVPVPSRAAQIKVAAQLDDLGDDIASGVGILTRSIELLQEFKRSLISAAVSGEFDVAAASGRGVPA